MITAIFDPEQTLLLDGRLRELGDLASGRVYCPIEIGYGNLEALANALLAGLGKRTLGRDQQRSAAFKWDSALAWLEGEQARHVFLAGIEDLKPAARQHVLQLSSGDLHVWAVYGERRCEQWLTRGSEASIFDVDQFLQHWDGVQSPPRPAVPQPYPRAPNEEFARFRTACYWELPRDQFRIVNRTWRRAYVEAVAWPGSGAGVDEAALARQLQLLICSCTDYQEAVVAIRAAQAALLRQGYLLKLLLHRFARGAELASAADLERGAAERLRWYTGPARPAAAILRLLAPAASPSEIADLSVDDVAADGSEFTIGGIRAVVPPIASGMLRAQHAARRLLEQGASQYLLYRRGHQAVAPTEKALMRWLRDITEEAGINLAGQTTRHERLDARNWVSRRGLTIHKLFEDDGHDV